MQSAPFMPPGEMGLWLGSDSLGRDVAAGIAYGSRVSLLVGGVSTVVALAIGVTLGAVAGYAGGWVDDALMRFTEFFQTIPSFILAVVLVAIFKPEHQFDRGRHCHRVVAARHAGRPRRISLAASARIRSGGGGAWSSPA